MDIKGEKGLESVCYFLKDILGTGNLMMYTHVTVSNGQKWSINKTCPLVPQEYQKKEILIVKYPWEIAMMDSKLRRLIDAIKMFKRIEMVLAFKNKGLTKFDMLLINWVC